MNVTRLRIFYAPSSQVLVVGLLRQQCCPVLAIVRKYKISTHVPTARRALALFGAPYTSCAQRKTD